MKKASIPYTAKQLVKMVNNGTIKFDNPVQRGLVWEVERKSLLIASMIEHYPIPAFYAILEFGENGKNIYDIMDGQQRITTIVDFQKGGFALTGLEPVEYEDADGNLIVADINGKKFSELPEELQDEIASTSLPLYYFSEIKPEQIGELFRRLNNGKPLSAKAKNVAFCKDFDSVNEIAKHKVFAHLLTEKAMQSKSHVGLIMKMHTMLFNDIHEVSFDTNLFSKTIASIQMTDEEIKDIKIVLDYANGVFEEIVSKKTQDKDIKELYRKMKSEVHFVSLLPLFNKAIESSIPHSDFVEFAKQFFIINPDMAYTEVSKSSTAKNASIVSRNDILMESFNDFVAESECLPF